ncbi:unnamed protein product [Polarella glacialis]|uniref:Uncharacterized protein n=1 Tax=Polarella glacialis TaxID=89957 RepID=A0A813E8V6_POLGL|nr:unnamed protein product [Polarella glacialis]
MALRPIVCPNLSSTTTCTHGDTAVVVFAAVIHQNWDRPHHRHLTQQLQWQLQLALIPTRIDGNRWQYCCNSSRLGHPLHEHPAQQLQWAATAGRSFRKRSGMDGWMDCPFRSACPVGGAIIRTPHLRLSANTDAVMQSWRCDRSCVQTSYPQPRAAMAIQLLLWLLLPFIKTGTALAAGI